MKIIIPHIHKITGDAGFWAKVAREGKIEKLRLKTLEGLRQIEGILIGRKVQEVPIVVSRVCGICPVVHILNSCRALEKALEIKVSPLTCSLRKLILASQIIQSHALHLFFMALPDFFNITNEIDLQRKFKKEAKAALKIRDYSLKIIEIVGGRATHPISLQIGGFLKLPEKSALKKILKDYLTAIKSAQILAEISKNLPYPKFKRKQIFVSLFSAKEYSYYQSDFIQMKDRKSSIGDFYSNQIEEDLKNPPLKKVKHPKGPYMLGAIARVKNNSRFLNPQAKEFFESFKKKNNLAEEDFFENTYHNFFCQALEILHFTELTEKLIKKILKSNLKERKKEIKISKGSGLSAMEAPRGTLFTYFEIDKQGRILNCNIITPTAQFLTNLEEDLKYYVPKILKISEKERIKKIKSLIRIYDPCIACAIH